MKSVTQTIVLVLRVKNDLNETGRKSDSDTVRDEKLIAIKKMGNTADEAIGKRT